MSISTTSTPVDCSFPPRDAGAQPGSLSTPADAAAFANFLTAFGPITPNAPVPLAPLPLPLPIPVSGEFSLDPSVDAPSAPIATSEPATSLTAIPVATGEPEIESPIDQVVVPRRVNASGGHKPTVLAGANNWRPMAAPKPVVVGEDSAMPASLDATAQVLHRPTAGGEGSGKSAISDQDDESLPVVPEAVAVALPGGVPATVVPVEGNAQPLVSSSFSTPVDQQSEGETPDTRNPTVGRRTMVTAKTPTSTAPAPKTLASSAPPSTAITSSAHASNASEAGVPIPTGFDRVGERAAEPMPKNGPHVVAPAAVAAVNSAPPPLATMSGLADHARPPAFTAAPTVASVTTPPSTGQPIDFTSSDSERESPDESRDELPSADLPIGSVPAGSPRMNDESRPTDARGFHVRSFGGRMDRAADCAEASGGPSRPDRSANFNLKNNTMLTVSNEGDANSSAFAGIAPANVTATMIKRAFSPAEQTTVAQAATSVATLSPFLDSKNPEEPAAVAAPMVAVRAVMLAAERSVHEANPTVDLRFDLEGMDSLHVRVECRAGVVHTTFRSDSSEMREIISREWAAQTAQAESRGVRLAEPVFNTNTSPRSPDDSPSGRQRDRRSSRETEGGAEIVSFNPRRAARGRAAASTANSPLGFHAVA